MVIEGAFGFGACMSSLKPLVGHCLGSSRSESSNLDLPLPECWKILFQRLYPRRTVEHQNVIVKLLRIKIPADGLVHRAEGEFDIVFLHQVGDICFVRVGEWHEEILILVLHYNINKILEFGFPVEDLPFAVDNIFLQVKCHVFGDAEILHGIRDRKAHLITDPEVMINGSFRGKNHCGKIGQVDFLLPEVLGRYTFHLNKLSEVYFQVVFFSELKIRRFRIVWLRLRH